ncbi:MAG: 50S ribosomal protein L11 methyltransferase [Ruminococcaceae bacterium]|nr:50S ribosomal protein L11 methyltransferase [Oscillospiraceae bacterium]
MDENKNWIQIKVKCESRDIDTVSGVMTMVDAGLMIEDFSDVDLILDGVYGDLIDESILEADRTKAAVSVFISTMKSPAESELFIKQRLEALGIDFEITHEGVCEEDWADSWKQYYKPIKTGKRLVIVPVWETYEKEDGEIIVLMDPGMAFGTGTHETTRLCAGLVEKHTTDGCSVLDVGCGSGILAIAAAKLGAGKCFACDIDPVAVRVAIENTELNNTPNVRCEVSDLLKQAEKVSGGYNVVVANIVADIIIRLAPDVGDYLAENGVFIVSGIIEERAHEVLDALDAAGYRVDEERYENGWYAAAVVRK